MTQVHSPVILVFARVDSRRFPGKALAHFGGLPLLEVVLRRTSRVRGAQTVLATSDRDLDDPLEELATRLGLLTVRGSTHDLASRVLTALGITRAEIFARVNGDSPLVDPELLQQGLARMRGEVDLVTNLRPRSFPYGVAVEWVRASTYRRLEPLAEVAEREHVTVHLYRLFDSLTTDTLECPLGDLSQLRLTVDQPSDLHDLQAQLDALRKDVLQVTYQDFSEFQARRHAL